MRLLIAQHGAHEADRICNTSREAKRVLNECVINDLLIAYGVDGRETGLDILRWAAAKRRLPDRVIVIERNLSACKAMGDFLESAGYRTFDHRQYVNLQ